MNTLSFFTTVAACVGLAACSSTTTPTTPTINIGGQAAHVGTTYSADVSGVLTDITVSPIMSSGQPIWVNVPAGTRIAGYESANVLAIGGFNNGQLIQGLTGVLSSPPQTGTATYSGFTRWADIGSAAAAGVTNLPISMAVDFNAGTFSNTAAGPNIIGTITGQQFTGTFQIGGVSGALVPMTGGFFGTNEMAGTFGNSTRAGVIYATKP